jgi:hypothetical protein
LKLAFEQPANEREAQRRRDALASPLAKAALKALAKAMRDNGGLPLTDRERGELAAKLRPAMSLAEAGRLGGKNNHQQLGMRYTRPLDDTDTLMLALRISRRSLARARERAREE